MYEDAPPPSPPIPFVKLSAFERCTLFGGDAPQVLGFNESLRNRPGFQLPLLKAVPRSRSGQKKQPRGIPPACCLPPDARAAAKTSRILEAGDADSDLSFPASKVPVTSRLYFMPPCPLSYFQHIPPLFVSAHSL